MLQPRFQSWAERVPAGARADAARDLACAFLYADVDAAERADMERALTALLDDASPLVRRALAETLARASHAPHHLISALSADQADIAAIVLCRSPILTDAELIDAAAVGEARAQAAIAARPGLSASVAGALAEVGGIEPLRVLCRNLSATLAEVSVRRMLERFGADGELREGLLARRDLGSPLRHAVTAATAEALRDFTTRCGWLVPERARRLTREAVDRAAVALAHGEGGAGLSRLAAHLRDAGHLTPVLMMRALLSGQTPLFEACLAELSGQSAGRVAGLVRCPESLAFAALIRSAGLSDSLLPVLRAALAAPHARTATAALRLDLVSEVLARCPPSAGAQPPALAALLRRFEAEAAREAACAPAPARRPALPAPVPGPPAPPVGRRPRIEPRFGVAA